METARDLDIDFAQGLITCHLCKNKVELFCNSCNKNLCGICVGKHMLAPPPQKHDVVIYSLKLATTPQPFCTTHSYCVCYLQCQDCDVFLCGMCIKTEEHSQHEIKEVAEIFKMKEAFIAKETSFLEEKIIPEYERIIKKIKQDILVVPAANLKQEVSDQRYKLYCAVDRVINKHLENIESKENQIHDSLTKNLAEFQDILYAVMETIKNNKELLQSRDIDIINFKSKAEEFLEVPPLLNIKPAKLTKANITDEDIGGIIGQIDLPSISSFEDDDIRKKLKEYISMLILLDRPEIIATFKTKYDKLSRVSCLGNDQAWISGNTGIITRIDSKGLVQETVKTTTGRCPFGLTVTKEEDLLYTDFEDKSINQVRNGKASFLIRTEWNPSGICSSSSGDILVSMCNMSSLRKQFKVVRYRNESIGQIIQSNGNESWFQEEGTYSCLQIAVNMKGDICVADWNASCVLIFGQEGQLKSRISMQNVSNVVTNFHPDYITTDSQCHILVSDYRSDCVHILDENGQRISVIDTCNIKNLRGVCVDSKDRLWVVEFSGKLKIIKYME